MTSVAAAPHARTTCSTSCRNRASHQAWGRSARAWASTELRWPWRRGPGALGGISTVPFSVEAARGLQSCRSRHGDREQRLEGAKARALAVDVTEDRDLERAKYELFNALIDTRRGVETSAEQRAVIEEALVGVERFDAGTQLELDKLDGTWLLQYTTAPDVVQILQASKTAFLQVGQIFQKFECVGRTDGGIVKNVVRWSIPGVLEDEDGATLVVTAKFSVVSPRNIALSFEEAQVGQIGISEGLQAFLAPAFLPRTYLNLEILQYLRRLNVRVPLNGSTNSTEDKARIPLGVWYYLTYVDYNMLLGRAIGSGGIFIFSRTQQIQLP